MIELNLYPISETLFLRPLHKPAQKRGVSFLRVLGLPSLHAQILQKIVHRQVHPAGGIGSILHGSQSDLPVNRVNASRYFACVLATTSLGKVGAGGVLFQSNVSR